MECAGDDSDWWEHGGSDVVKSRVEQGRDTKAIGAQTRKRSRTLRRAFIDINRLIAKPTGLQSCSSPANRYWRVRGGARPRCVVEQLRVADYITSPWVYYFIHHRDVPIRYCAL
jgi:hypothetical protein